MGRGLEELERRGWDRCVVASDGWGIACAAQIALLRPDRVAGLALGHAKLSYAREGERAPVNGEVLAGFTKLIETDHEQFVRHGATQVTGGSIDERQAKRMLARIHPDLFEPAWEAVTRDDVDIGELLTQVDCPLLFAKHEGCLVSTEEGFEDAAATFPRARTVTVSEAPLASESFAAALREFCQEALAS